MPLTAADFERPSGRLSPAWFSDDLGTSLAAWIAEAEGKSSDADAQTAWVYHRAYQTLADDRSLVAATIAADDVRESYSDSQLTRWQQLADAALADFNRVLGVGGPFFTPVCT